MQANSTLHPTGGTGAVKVYGFGLQDRYVGVFSMDATKRFFAELDFMTEKPPRHLGKAAKTWWLRVVDEFQFASAGELQCLSEAASSLDRIEQCREIIKNDGLFITGDRGSVIHPAARLEQQHRSLVLQACRQLGISSPVKP